jgi:uncharacterized protein
MNLFIKKENFNKVNIVGESLGTVLASYNASLDPSYKLLLISPFYKFVDVAKSNFPFYPVFWMLLDNYDSSKLIDRLDQVTIIHGDQDDVISINEAKKYFQAIISKNKIFISVPGGGHNNLYSVPLVQQSIINFLNH